MTDDQDRIPPEPKRKWGMHLMFYAVWLHGSVLWLAVLGLMPVNPDDSGVIVMYALAYLLIVPLWHFFARRRNTR